MPASPPPPPPRPAREQLSAPEFDAAAAGDADPDGDSLVEPADRCPEQAEDRDGHEDDDGCPDPDNDVDGVPDEADLCPFEPETVNGVEDDDGCPDEGEAAVAVVGDKVTLNERVEFARGSARLEERSHALLEQVAGVLKARPDVRRVRVEGHTDGKGDPEGNVDLSERRAWSVREFLVSHGVAAERLEARGFGPTRPVASNGSAKGRARNRRVEVTILDQAAAEAAP